MNSNDLISCPLRSRSKLGLSMLGFCQGIGLCEKIGGWVREGKEFYRESLGELFDCMVSVTLNEGKVRQMSPKPLRKALESSSLRNPISTW